MESALIKLYNTGEKLLSISSPEKIFATLIAQATDLVGAEYGSIYLWQKNSFKRVYTNIPPNQLVTPRQQGFAKIVLESREPCIIPREEILRFNPHLSKTNIKARIYIPLLFNNFSIGVLTLRLYKKKRITAKEIKSLKIFASLATFVIERLLLYEEMQKIKATNESLVNFAAHELRTPLTSINIYLDLLNKKKHISKIIQKKILTNLTNASYKLAKVAEDLITINNNKNSIALFYVKNIKLLPIIKESMQLFSLNYSRKITLIKKSNLVFSLIKGDKSKLKSVFFTILQYMHKSSSKESTIIITYRHDDPYYVISFETESENRLRNKKFKNNLPAKNLLKENANFSLSRKIIEQHRGFLTTSFTENSEIIITVYIPKLL